MKPVPARIICDDYKVMSRATAGLFLEASALAISKRGKFNVALSGGSTPKEFFKILASPAFNKKINWKKIFFYWSDERFVPLDSKASNFHLAKKYLFDKISIPPSNLLPVPVKGLPENAAKKYEQSLKKKLGNRMQFDWVMLGVGTDGHTASLFPGSKGLTEIKKNVIAVWTDTDQPWRISFSFPLINKARQIIILVSGEEKAPVVKAVFSKRKTKTFPVEYVDPLKSLWLIDKNAAK